MGELQRLFWQQESKRNGGRRFGDTESGLSICFVQGSRPKVFGTD